MDTKLKKSRGNTIQKNTRATGSKKITIRDRLISEQDLSEKIINCLPGVFYLHDRAGNYLLWNKNFETASGYKKEEITKLHPLDFFHERDHERYLREVKKVFDLGYNEFETEVITKSGKTLLYHLNGVSVNYEGKLCLLGTGIDLSEREQAQERIKKSEEKYHALFEQASDPIVITEFDGKIIDINSSFCKLFGYTRKELTSMNIEALIFSDPEKNRPLRHDLLIKGKHIFSDRLMVRKDGSTVETEANLKKFGENRVMGIVRDVTVIRKLQREMEQERLEQNEQEQKKITRAVIKAQERERNSIGRELQDHVNQLLSNSKLSLSTGKQTLTAKKDFIDKSIRLIDAAMFEIRVLSNKHLTPGKGFDLPLQIRSLVKIMEEGIGFKITFEEKIPEGFEIAFDIKLNLYRVIQEQLDNVYKHGSASRVQIRLTIHDHLIHLSIKDDGIGSAIGLKKNGEGIVNIINRVESFNGTVSFIANTGVGSTLAIDIPLNLHK